jgi:hypothetical protein
MHGGDEANRGVTARSVDLLEVLERLSGLVDAAQKRAVVELLRRLQSGCVDPMVAERRAKAFTAGTIKAAMGGATATTPPGSLLPKQQKLSRRSSTQPPSPDAAWTMCCIGWRTQR